MKNVVLLFLVFFFSFNLATAASKSCDDVKAEIAVKLTAAGVKSYELTILAKDEPAEGKIVGSCERGFKKIIYTKRPVQNSTTAALTAKPEINQAATFPEADKKSKNRKIGAVKSCDELRAEISAKLTAAGVKFYELKFLAKDGSAAGKIVGSCENGSKKIIYLKK